MIENLFITDIVDKKIVISRFTINNENKYLVLWRNEDYDNIGDWTQAQANARIEELLGNDI